MTEPHPPSGAVPLREFIEEQFRAHAAVHVALAEAADRAAEFQKTAIDKAEEAQKEWRVASNEWRSAMTDREQMFVSKAEYVAALSAAVGTHDLTNKRLDALEDAGIRRQEREDVARDARVKEETRRAEDQRRQQWLVGTFVFVASVIVNVLIRLASGA